MEEDLIDTTVTSKMEWASGNWATAGLILSKNHKRRKFSFFLQVRPHMQYNASISRWASAFTQSLPVPLSQEPMSLTAMNPNSSPQELYGWGPEGQGVCRALDSKIVLLTFSFACVVNQFTCLQRQTFLPAPTAPTQNPSWVVCSTRHRHWQMQSAPPSCTLKLQITEQLQC